MHVLYGEGTTLHTSKRMHFIEEPEMHAGKHSTGSCIRQNVCTSLRNHIVSVSPNSSLTCIRQNVCTSLRSLRCTLENTQRVLAYVKTYALH